MRKVYLEPSILVPALMGKHPHHQACINLLGKLSKEKAILLTTNHTFAEVYSTLTKLPMGLAPPSKSVLKVIENSISPLFTPISLTQEDYSLALERCAQKELISGIIYDALHLQAAIKAGAHALYTANFKDFERLWDEGILVKLEGV